GRSTSDLFISSEPVIAGQPAWLVLADADAAGTMVRGQRRAARRGLFMRIVWGAGWGGGGRRASPHDGTPGGRRDPRAPDLGVSSRWLCDRWHTATLNSGSSPWPIACESLELVLRHDPDLLRQRGPAPGPCVHDDRRRRAGPPAPPAR